MRRYNFLATTYEEYKNVVFLYPFPLNNQPPLEFEIINPFTAEPTQVKMRGSSSRIFELRYYKEFKVEQSSQTEE